MCLIILAQSEISVENWLFWYYMKPIHRGNADWAVR